MHPCQARVFTLLVLSFVLAALSGSAQTTDYTELSLEELTAVRIFTLGRKQATLFDTPAAASVITNEDIHRSGALDLAEALRLVAGLQVARIDSFSYGVTARGFEDATSNKLLVLTDGRSLYSTTSTGAVWNYHELVLEDLDRIEVLRGPGASLWGANAMNGVVNIVTRPAEATLGSMLTVAHGDQLGVSVALREGFRLNSQTAVRVYAKYHDEGDYGVTHDTASGGWSNRLIGTRLDWQSKGAGRLTIIGEQRSLLIDSTTELPTLFAPYSALLPETQRSRGGNLSAHWTQPIFENGELSALATFERVDSTQVAYGEDRDTYGLDLQLTLHPFLRHEVITGLTFRQDRDHLTDSAWFKYTPSDAKTQFTGAYLQDEISVLPDRLLLTIGSKFERNSFSGWESQPSLRAIFRTSKTQRTWMGLSRAARTPSRLEHGVDFFAYTNPPSDTFPFPATVQASGSRDFRSEHVTALEFGHRYEPTYQLSFDLSLYYNFYDDLRGTWYAEPVFALAPVPHAVQTVYADNSIKGSTYGGEFEVRWQPGPTFKLEASVASVRMDLHQRVASPIPDPSIAGIVGATPHQEYKLRAQWDPLPHWSVDTSVRHVEALPGPQLPSYTGFDARIAWHPDTTWEVDLVGRDLLDKSHGESSKNFIGDQVRETARSVFLRVTYHH